MVVTDKTKCQWTVKTVSSQKEDTTGTKVAKMVFGMGGGFTKFEGAIQVIDNDTSGVLYAYNVKKGNFQSAAEAFAKHVKDDYLKNRTMSRPQRARPGGAARYVEHRTLVVGQSVCRPRRPALLRTGQLRT